MYTPNDGKAEVFLVVIKDEKQKLEKYRISVFFMVKFARPAFLK